MDYRFLYFIRCIIISSEMSYKYIKRIKDGHRNIIEHRNLLVCQSQFSMTATPNKHKNEIFYEETSVFSHDLNFRSQN